MWTSHQCGIVLLRNYSYLRYFVPGHYTNNGQATLDNGRFVKVEWTAFILLRKSVRPGKGNYVKEEKGWVLGCGSRRFHPFSPSYLGTFSGFCLWVVFVLFSYFGVEGTRIYFLQVFFDIKSLVDRQCLELAWLQQKRNGKPSRVSSHARSLWMCGTILWEANKEACDVGEYPVQRSALLWHTMEVRWKACKLDMPCGHCLWVFLWLNDGMTK